MSGPTVVVTGIIATIPVGGTFWDYVQYALGLERLGCDVWYLEDLGWEIQDDDVGRGLPCDWEAGAERLGALLAEASPTLGSRWQLRSWDDRTFGVPLDEMAEVVAGADAFVNVSGVGLMRPEYLPCRRKVLIDTDPGWNHFGSWPDAEARAAPGDPGLRAYDAFFTYAERLGRPGCILPDLGFRWHPTRPPVLVDLWDDSGLPGDRWTTVLTWNNLWAPVEHEGVEYGAKERELPKIEDLPARVPWKLEIAAGGVEPPLERWEARGWSSVLGPTVTGAPEDYRAYVQASRGELSVAKHVYVATRSGWFSCRSACYLAAGRPVVLQDTGFSDVLPTGEGLVAFDDEDGAAAGLAAVEADYDRHAAAARDLARQHLDAEQVLGSFLDRLEING